MKTTVEHITPSDPAHPKGSLTVVGTGIQLGGHITVEALNALRHADKVFYLVSGNLTGHWIAGLNQSAESLADLYGLERRRSDTYAAMAARIVEAVRLGRRVCAAFYGHPGVFVQPARTALRMACQEGYRAEMLPGISALDCLFADLDLDPATSGCQIFEASDFVTRHRQPDNSSFLILLQVGAMGVTSARRPATTAAVAYLVERLSAWYPPTHEVVMYQASRYPIEPALIRRIPLEDLAHDVPDPRITLVLPPSRVAERDPMVVSRINSL